jgi:hypothetical protein
VPIARAVIAAAFLNPFEAAVHIVSLVGLVLIQTGEHSRSASGLAGVFWRYRSREYRIGIGRIARRCGIVNARRLGRLSGVQRRCCGRSSGRRLRRRAGRGRRGARSALGLLEFFPAHAVERLGSFAGYLTLHSCMLNACAGMFQVIATIAAVTRCERERIDIAHELRGYVPCEATDTIGPPLVVRNPNAAAAHSVQRAPNRPVWHDGR